MKQKSQVKLVIWSTPPSSSQLFSVENSITSQQMHIAATLMLSRWKILTKNKILLYQPVLYFCWEDTLRIQTEASPLLLDIKETWWGKKKNNIKGEVIEMLKWTWNRQRLYDWKGKALKCFPCPRTPSRGSYQEPSATPVSLLKTDVKIQLTNCVFWSISGF